MIPPLSAKIDEKTCTWINLIRKSLRMLTVIVVCFFLGWLFFKCRCVFFLLCCLLVHHSFIFEKNTVHALEIIKCFKFSIRLIQPFKGTDSLKLLFLGLGPSPLSHMFKSSSLYKKRYLKDGHRKFWGRRLENFQYDGHAITQRKSGFENHTVSQVFCYFDLILFCRLWFWWWTAPTGNDSVLRKKSSRACLRMR